MNISGKKNLSSTKADDITYIRLRKQIGKHENTTHNLSSTKADDITYRRLGK